MKEKTRSAPKTASTTAVEWPHDLVRAIYNAPETRNRTKRRIRFSLPPVEVDYRGVRMLIHPSDNNTEFQIWRMGRTHEERALRTILNDLKGKPFLAYDVGANAGSFALRLAAAGSKTAVIHAFEPNPVMHARLKKNIALNGFKTITLHDCAISDSEGTTDLHVPAGGNFGQARIIENFEGGETQKVAMHRLSKFVSKTGRKQIDFLKVDIEGFEDRAILPLLEDIPQSRWPRQIFFEHKHSPLWREDVPLKLVENNYTLAREFGRNALFSLNPEV